MKHDPKKGSSPGLYPPGTHTALRFRSSNPSEKPQALEASQSRRAEEAAESAGSNDWEVLALVPLPVWE